MPKTKAVTTQAGPPAAPPLPPGAVWKGNPILLPFLVPVASLYQDPANANTHPERSLAAIAAAYNRFGQQKPIVCDKDLTVRDGNGQHAAVAQRLGWTHIACIPSNLDSVEVSAYALAVNRTAEHAEWDFGALAAQVRAIAESGAPVDDLGWDGSEMEALLKTGWSPPGGDAEGPGEFETFDETIGTEHKCPKCGYAWSGNPT